MRRLRVASALASVVTCAIIFVACGDDDNAPVFTPKDGGGTTVDATPLDPDASKPVDEDAGAFTIVDVPDVPCTMRGAVDKTVFTGGFNDPVVSLTPIGARRIALRGSGFYLVDADGSNPSTAIAESAFAAAIDDDDIASVISNGMGPELSLYGANGALKSNAGRAFQGSSFGLTVAGGGSTGLVAFATQFGAYARGIAPSGYYSEAFLLAAFGDYKNFRASIARKDDGTFGVAMSGEAPVTADESRLSFVRANTTNRLGAGYNLEIGPKRRKVVQLVARKKGWALLVEYDVGLRPHLVLLDDQGRIEGPVLRLAGAGRGFGLATVGDELGVFALHDPVSGTDAGTADAGEGGAPLNLQYAAFRPFDANGAPLGGWVCIGDGVQTGGIAGAILGETSGYSVMYPRANGDIVFGRFDTRGN